MPHDIACSPLKSGGPHYRIDKFIVPEAGLTDFLKQVEQVDAALSALPGCLQHLVMIQEAHPGEPDIHVLTLVEWASAAHMDAAKACVLSSA